MNKSHGELCRIDKCNKTVTNHDTLTVPPTHAHAYAHAYAYA